MILPGQRERDAMHNRTVSDGDEQQTGSEAPPVLSNRRTPQASFNFGKAKADRDPNSVARFDLFKHSACVTTLVLFVVLMSVTVYVALPLGESYVGGYPLLLFAAAGSLVAGLVWWINHAGGVPRGVVNGLAITGAALGVALAHPVMLKINAFTDGGYTEDVEYVRMADNRFRPQTGDWPSIDMIGSDYWRNTPGEIRRIIPMRKGGLGFYQADLTEIRFELELTESLQRIE